MNNSFVPSDQLSKAAAILWFGKPTWTAEEAAILLAGVTPEQFKTLIREVRLQETEQRYYAIRDALTNANNKAAEIQVVFIAANFTEPAAPIAWLQRARDLDLDIPASFARFLVSPANQNSANTNPALTVVPLMPAEYQAGAPPHPRKKPQGGDSLTPLVWEICYDRQDRNDKVTAGPVMAELQALASSKPPKKPLMSATAGGVKYELYEGEESELSSKALAARILEWKNANQM